MGCIVDELTKFNGMCLEIYTQVLIPIIEEWMSAFRLRQASSVNMLMGTS